MFKLWSNSGREPVAVKSLRSSDRARERASEQEEDTPTDKGRGTETQADADPQPPHARRSFDVKFKSPGFSDLEDALSGAAPAD